MRNSFVVLLLSLLLVVTCDVYAESTKASKEDIKQMCATLCKDDGRMYSDNGSVYYRSDRDSSEYTDNSVREHKSFLDLSFIYWLYYLAYYLVTLLIAVLIYKHAKTRKIIGVRSEIEVRD